jgi:hypothetical protein
MVGLPETLTLPTFKPREPPARKHEVFVAPSAGYAGDMSDAEKPSPPGSPMRDDEASGDRPGGHDDDASAHPATGGHTIPIEDEQPDPKPEGEDELQEENAETSLDQPSQ